MKFGLACRSAVVMLPPKYTVEFCLQKISDTVQVISFLYFTQPFSQTHSCRFVPRFSIRFFFTGKRELLYILLTIYYITFWPTLEMECYILFFEAKIKSLLQEFNFQKYRWHTDYNGGIISETVYLFISYMFHR